MTAKKRRRNVALRDWFAGMAMQSFISKASAFDVAFYGGADPAEWVATEAYAMADAMLKERER